MVTPCNINTISNWKQLVNHHKSSMYTTDITSQMIVDNSDCRISFSSTSFRCVSDVAALIVRHSAVPSDERKALWAGGGAW